MRVLLDVPAGMHYRVPNEADNGRLCDRGTVERRMCEELGHRLESALRELGHTAQLSCGGVLSERLARACGLRTYIERQPADLVLSLIYSDYTEVAWSAPQSERYAHALADLIPCEAVRVTELPGILIYPPSIELRLGVAEVHRLLREVPTLMKGLPQV